MVAVVALPGPPFRGGFNRSMFRSWASAAVPEGVRLQGGAWRQWVVVTRVNGLTPARMEFLTGWKFLSAGPVQRGLGPAPQVAGRRLRPGPLSGDIDP